LSDTDRFLEAIRNGTWFSLIKLTGILNIPPDKLEETANTLSQEGLIEYDKSRKWVKINPEWRTIFTDEEEMPKHKPSIATLIIPSKESIFIQKIQITNLTDKDIELWIRTYKDQVKLAVSEFI